MECVLYNGQVISQQIFEDKIRDEIFNRAKAYNASLYIPVKNGLNDTISKIQNETLTETDSYINEDIKKRADTIELLQYKYEQLSGTNPTNITKSLLNYVQQKLNVTTQKALQGVFKHIGDRNNVLIHFHNKTPQYRDKQVLGWYSDGDINYNANEITIDTYMHEFSHLWMKVLKSKDINTYDEIIQKVENFLKSDTPFAKLVNKRLASYPNESVAEEAAAIIAGFVSLPAFMKFVSNELSLNDMSYSEIVELFGDNIANIYMHVRNEFDMISSLSDIDIPSSNLYSIFNAFVNDIFNGNNPFEIYGETLEQLKVQGDLNGYMENNVGTENIITTISDFKNALKNDVIKRKEFEEMTSVEIEDFIKSHFNKFSYKKINGQWVWSMMGYEIEIDVTKDGITPESISSIKNLVLTVTDKQLDTWIEVGNKIAATQSSRRISPTNNPAADVILDTFKTRYGNTKYNVSTAKKIADIMGFSTGVHDVFRLEDIVQKYPSVFGFIDKNLIKELNVLVVLHNDPRGDDPSVQISLFSLEKIVNHISPSKEKNIFNKFESVQDKDVIKHGAALRNNSSSINNLMLGFVVAHLANNIKNLRIRTIATLEMTREFRPAPIELNVLMKAIGYIKNVPALFNLIQNEEIKNIIEKANDNKYTWLNQSAEDKLKTFYYNGVYYSSDTEEFIKGKSTEYFSMTKTEKKSFLRARMKYLENYYGTSSSSALMADPEYKLIANEYKSLDDIGYSVEQLNQAAEKEMGFRHEIIKKLALPHNIKSDVVQWAINSIQTNERLVIHHFRKYRDEFHKVLKPVWKNRTSVLPKMSDIGSKTFEHMFITKEQDGIKFKLPYIYFNGHEIFKGMTESQKREELNRLNLTEDDLALGDFIMEAVENALIEAEFIDLQNAATNVDQANKVTKAEAKESILKKGWRKETGQVFVISKSASELTASGKIKAGYERFKQQSVDINTIFEDQVLVEELGTLRNTFSNQLSHDILLQMAGIEYQGDNKYRLFDKEKNDRMSTNLETITNYAVMSSIRQLIHSRESEFVYKAALAMINDMWQFAASNDKKSYERLKEYLEEYWESMVKGKRIDGELTLWMGKKSPKVNIMAGVDMATRAMSFSLIAYRPKLVLKSFSYNLFNAILWGAGNIFGRGEGLPTLTDIMKASAIYAREYERVVHWASFYQIANASAYETLNSAVQNVSKKYALNDQVGYIALQFTDEAWRHIVMLSYLIKDGSWDAHTYHIDENGNGVIKYDEKNDKRLYEDGVLTEKGKVLKAAIKNDLVEQGLMDESDTELKYGYDMQEAVMMKTLADKWVIGSMSADAAANITHDILGRQFAKFRRFVFDNLANMGLGTDPGLSRVLSRRVVKQDEEGNYYSVKEMREVVGVIQSWIQAFNVFKEHRFKGFSELQNLSEASKANLSRSLLWIVLLLILKALFGKFRDEDERRRYYLDLHRWLIDTSVWNNVSDIERSPFPMYGAFQRFIETGINDPIRLLYYLPGGGLVKDTQEIINSFEKENK